MGARAVGQRLTLATLTSSLVFAAATGVGAAAITDEEFDEAPVPDVVMRDFDPAEFSAPAAELPADLVAAIERDLGISPQRYLARAAAAKVAVDVVDSLGELVSSAWLDGETLHVSVNNRGDTAVVAATGASVHVGDALADAVRAARSQGQIAFADRRADNLVPVEAAISAEPALSSDAPDIGPWAERLSGGFAIVTEHDDGFATCSAGFNGTTAEAGPAAITAAHCAGGGPTGVDGPISVAGSDRLVADDTDEAGTDEADTDDNTLLDDLTDGLLKPDESAEEPNTDGDLVARDISFGGGHDMAVLDVLRDDVGLRPRVAAPDGAAGQGRSLPVFDAIAPLAGAPACKAGVSSGWTCGTVVATEATVPVNGEDVTGFLLDACAVPGDGGGPIVVGYYAVGVVSGSTRTDADCAGPAQDVQVSVGYPLTSGEPKVGALHGSGWRLAVHVGAPEVKAPVDGDVTGQRPTFRGRIDAAAGANVTVRIDGETVEAAVKADGSWRIPVEEPLTPGRHTYTITAAHTPVGGERVVTSAPVEGSFEVAEVATLVVQSPTSGETTTAAQPRFSGTGDPGARITLAFDGSSTAAIVADDGTWSLSPSPAERAGRFDATITQETTASTDDVAVERIGIVPGAPMVVASEEEPDGGYSFRGTAAPGSTVAVRVQPGDSTNSSDSGEAADPGMGDSAADAGTRVGEHVTVADTDGQWKVESVDLPPGRYAVSAVQAVDDLTSERSAAVALEIGAQPTESARADAAASEDDLAQTGSVVGGPVMAAVVLLMAGGVIFVTAHRRATV
ncbi:Ig-like domain-containing protein [Phytoactinopolyspora limicola]|uniref:Ig-like domain-containing protein n=1 Tax=Phytoactinopolyspora limicola TaxID=2715536 RepID=UPI00140E62D6|nr:Ig-like domain-containing protein [Phytoactinopolyspora limicola]